MRSISILGSTGSIGCNTLKVIDHLGDRRVVAMAAGRNLERFAEQIVKYRPEVVSCSDERGADRLEKDLKARAVDMPRIVHGVEGLIEVATHVDADVVVSATVGAVGFKPTLAAIEAGKRIALANKETLVMAGELMMSAAESSGAEILPVDSEHNAIHQCLRGERRHEVQRLVLTASGGPLRTWSKERIEHATRDEALDHPNWDMGEKITVDSATLMNKGFEVIEAKWLFGVEPEHIDVVIHPQSVIHSMVEMVDGSVLAQMGVTDMKHAIQYALTYPERQPGCLPSLDLARLQDLTFEDPDRDRFPCLRLAYEAMGAGGTSPATLNAANEVAVEAFLSGRISFGEIGRINERVLERHSTREAADMTVIMAADQNARQHAHELLAERAGAMPALA
jgi:1-deoxy-D-xylulose-5-phosphate reductoisomerase